MQNSLDSLIEELKTGRIKAIENLIERKEQEQFFVDFKTTEIDDYSLKNGLGDSDRNNLSKALSWFWNSEWWILIWWVDGKDFATWKKIIKGVDKFVSLINTSISRCVIPQHNTVENFIIHENENDWFVVTIIPKSNNTPHRTADGKKEWQYYMRAWESFLPVPHSVLAWMFWRRPSPEIIYKFSWNINHRIQENGIFFEAWFLLRNQWLWIARDIFANAMIINCPESMNNTEIFKYQQNSKFTATMVFWRWLNCYSDNDLIIAPEQWGQPFTLQILLKPPFDNDLNIQFIVWCEWGIPCKWNIEKSKEELQSIYDSGIQNPDSKEITTKIFN